MPSDMIQEFRQWQKTEGISLNLEWIGTESVNEPQMEVSSGSYKLDRLFYFMGGNYGRWTDAGMSDKNL